MALNQPQREVVGHQDGRHRDVLWQLAQDGDECLPLLLEYLLSNDPVRFLLTWSPVDYRFW